MVEDKCFDIDERQTAAAQEQGSYKKSRLKNDQGQSLIALYMQVRHNIPPSDITWRPLENQLLFISCCQMLHEHHDFFLVP